MLPPHEAPSSPFFRAWAKFILRFRWPLLLLNLLATGFFFSRLADVVVDSSTEAFLASDSEAVLLLDEMRDAFGMDVYVDVVVGGDVFSEAFLKRLAALHDDLEKVDVELLPEDEEHDDEDAAQDAPEPGQGKALANAEGGDVGDDEGWDEFVELDSEQGWGDEAGGTIIEDVTSLINVRKTEWVHEGLHVGGLLEGFPERAYDLSALKKRVLADPTMVGRVVAPDGKHAVLAMQTRRLSETGLVKVYDATLAVAEKHEAEGFHVQVAGMPAINATLNRTMVSDSQRLAVLAVLLNLLALFVIFRHPMGVLGPLLVVVQAAIWTFGMMAVMGKPITIITNILPAFLIAVGLADSVHMQSVYRDARRDGMANQGAIIHALATTGMPVLFTTLTTAVGLLSFQFASLGAIQDFGKFGAFGVVVALAESILFLPLFLSFNTRSSLGVRERKQGSDVFDRVLFFCNNLSRPSPDGSRRRVWINVALTAVVAAVMGLGASLVQLRHNPLEWIPDELPGKQALTTMDEEVGGAAGLALMIEAKPGKDLKDRELLERLTKLEDYLYAYEEPQGQFQVVRNTTSMLDPIRESWRAVQGGAQQNYTVPDSQQGVVDMFTMFQTASPEETTRLLTLDMRQGLLLMRCRWLDAIRFAPLTEYVDAGIARFIGDQAIVRATGAVYNLVEVVHALLWDLLRSFGVAFVVITLIMILLLRDVKLGLVAMVPNLLPIVSIMGVMGFTGLPLDGSTMLIASIAIGIAVDDTIHYLHQFKAHLDMHGDVEAAIDHAFRHSGRAMLATSIVLLGGFLVNLAATMYNMQRFGGLVGLTIVFALLIDLICAPAILRAVYGSGTRRANKDARVSP